MTQTIKSPMILKSHQSHKKEDPLGREVRRTGSNGCPSKQGQKVVIMQKKRGKTQKGGKVKKRGK